MYNWIEKYPALTGKYLDKITPQISDRERVMRTLEIGRRDSYHDYIRPHEALKGKTPAEGVGLTRERTSG